jgi:RNA polymerase sigma factor (sigma-70 family)
MELEELLKDEKMSKDIKGFMWSIYNKYHLTMCIDSEDYEQEIYLHLIKKLKNFDKNKATIKTYLYTLIQSCALMILRSRNSRSEKLNKLEVENSFLSLDCKYDNCDETLYNTIIYDGNLEETTINNLIIYDILNDSILSDIEKRILNLMLSDLTQSAIAKELCISQSMVNHHFKKAKKKILIKYV